MLETAEGRILVINSRDLTERKAEEARKSAHLRYQQRIAAFGQSALACRESGELSADAVQQALLALGADSVGYFERGAEQGELVARALAGYDAEGKRTAVSSYDPRTSSTTSHLARAADRRIPARSAARFLRMGANQGHRGRSGWRLGGARRLCAVGGEEVSPRGSTSSMRSPRS